MCFRLRLRSPVFLAPEKSRMLIAFSERKCTMFTVETDEYPFGFLLGFLLYVLQWVAGCFSGPTAQRLRELRERSRTSASSQFPKGNAPSTWVCISIGRASTNGWTGLFPFFQGVDLGGLPMLMHTHPSLGF